MSRSRAVLARYLRWGIRAASMLSFLSAASCAGAPSSPAKTAAAITLPPGAAEIAAVREHAFRRSVPVTEVSRTRLRHVLEEQLAAHPTRDDDGTFARAFGFSPLEARISREATARLNAEQLVGLYVSDDRTIYVRPRTRGSSEIDPSDTLHEIAHALQDDVFGMAPIYADVGIDEALARRAVYEGDATAAAWAAEGIRKGRTARAAIAEHRVETGAQAAMLGIPQELEGSPSLSSSSILVRMELFFPYTAGSALVVEAYLAGGPKLVDGLFQKLPVSTEQVLHPEKYFAGEAPIPVATPSAPPGYRVLGTGTAGELRTRGLLELALPAERAIHASEGWGGDAYAVVARDESARPSVLWSTVWDDIEHAKRFAAALEEATRCDASKARCPLGPVAMRRRGARVAWTRGFEGAAPLDALLDLPAAKPPNAPPHGEVTLAPSTEGEEIVPANADRVQRAEHAGIEARVPPRFDELRTVNGLLGITQAHGRGVLTYDATPFDPAAFPRTVRSIVAVLNGMPLARETLGDVSLPIGAGKKAQWALSDGIGEVIFVAMPYCEGRGTLYVSTVARSEEAAVGLSQWMRSFTPSDPRLPPVCSDKKSDTKKD